MGKIIFPLVLFLSLVLMVGCASAPTATATVVVPPTATIGQLITNTPTSPAPAPILPPTATSIPTQKVEWTFATGEPIWGPITVGGGVVYFGSDDSYLYAVETTTHDLKWKFQTGGAVRSRPAVSKDLVYAASDDSNLYAVSIDDGALVWKTPIGKSAWKRNPQFVEDAIDFFTSSPTLQDNTVYVGGTDNNLYAISADTGMVSWKFAGTSMSTTIRHTPVVGNGMVYFGDFADFYAVDSKNGTQVWVYHVPEGNTIWGNGATLVDQMVYVVMDNAIVALDAITGKEKWNHNLVYAVQVPAYGDGVLYLDGCKEGSAFPIGAYDAASGKLLWTANPPSNWHLASPVLGKNNLYIGTNHNGLFAIDKKTGAIQWEIPVKSGKTNVGVNSTAAVADGMVYFGGMDGVLYAVKDQ
jgi:outer membrane protein assembly factor BamB